MKQRLKQFLSRRQKRHIFDPSRIKSAVILPLYYKQGEPHILFIKRTENVTAHKGQIAFPGGTYEEADRTLLNTALRECLEEIGLTPDKVELIGELDDQLSKGTNYVISPFVGFIPWPYQFQIDGKETEEIIEAPIVALLNEGRQRQEIIDGDTVDTYSYHYKGRIIWGATARILSKFLDIYTSIAQDE